jgi:predicted TIM-barrel fold metal-dependent hydrolase
MPTKTKLNQFEVIDFHVHVYPRLPWPESVEPVRQQIAQALRPLSKLQQSAQSLLRHIPAKVRPITDELGVPMVLPHLLVESDIFDLEREMHRESVTKAIVVPHPPLMSNDFVFYESKRIPGTIPAAFIDPETIKSTHDLEAFYNRGIRLFKINPLQSGVPAEAPYYKQFLSFLNSKKAILLLHTGAISSHLFKLPATGDIADYERWFQNYPDIRFVAAHMNFHEPEKAIAMAQKFNNLYLLTSWQAADTLKKAIRAIGSEKVLFASDWPLLGENISTQKQRLWSLFEKGDLNEEELSAIFSENAKKLLQIN